MERRALIAALLSVVVLILWYKVFAPVTPNRAGETPPAATPTASVVPPGGASAPVAAEGASPTKVEPAVLGDKAIDIPLQGDGWHGTVSSAGAVVRSFALTGYQEVGGGPLELAGGGPVALLSMATPGPWNQEPYSVERDGEGVRLRWSDGRGNWVEKRLTPGKGRFAVSIEVSAGGVPARGGVVVAVGRSPQTAERGRFASVGAVVRVAGKLERFDPAKLGGGKELGGDVQFAGVEDHYFLLALLPEGQLAGLRLNGAPEGGSAVAEVAAIGAGGVVKGTLYGGPKDHRVLSGYGRGLDETLSFGMFGFLSVAFLAALRWIHTWTSNWGLAIVVLTAGIRVLLFPLTHKSTVAMRRMQALQPKMKAIQERYQERAKKDPQVRQRMNQEVMALYKQEGVNPMGGCLPTLVQLPILWALYTLFANAIELRQAPFLLWVTDLSVPETLFSVAGFPVRPLAILMGASMFVQQKMAPQVGDPAQRRMFMMMPVIFTVMFYSFPSGLVLYWLVNNLLTIGQQLVTERLLRGTALAR